MPDSANDPAQEATPSQGEVRHLPVLARAPDARPLERHGLAALPAPVVAATGGFIAGVAAFVLMRVLRRPQPTARLLGRRARRRQEREIAASRSFLVDVHLLKR